MGKFRHGMCRRGAQSRIHQIWADMLRRCYNPNSKDYHRYGGRGIKVCDSWHDFLNFYADMGDDNGLTLERQDNDKDYYKENCEWASRKRQSNNCSTNLRIVIDGKTMGLADAHRYVDSSIKYVTVKWRVRRGWDHIDALLMPLGG